ncbi:MAG: GMC family oxidoreductase [Beijerinckiaceae bacterium]
MTAPPESADYVIVGAGSAGCVLADRLSADGSATVAVLEAGGKDNWIWFHIPVGYLFAIGNPRADWLFRTEPVQGLNGRQLNYPRGKVIGGCSAINAMIYMRGQAADYDGWRQAGLTGWGWSDVLPYFIRQEDHFAGASPLHGEGGPWRVDEPRMRWEILDAFIQAAASVGIRPTTDFNTGSNEGVGYFQVNQKNGRRWSAARGFLKPALSRPNLSLITHAETTRVIFDGRRAVGVEYRTKAGVKRITANREVILAAGAIGSPKILQLSGVGTAETLREFGIPVVANLPGVGANLQDHLQLRPVFRVSNTKTMNIEYQSLWKRGMMAAQYALQRKGPLTMAPSQLGAFTRSSAEFETPNVQFHVQPLSLDRFGEPMHPFAAFTVSVCNLRPTSAGFVRVASPNPADAPQIQPHYLSTPEDRQVAADSIKLARRIVAQEPLRKFRPEEYKPGLEFQTDAELEKAAGEIGTTIFHPVGTAKMGVATDPMAVLDERLRVRQVVGLRVADASAMPKITSGNTNSPTMMIAEKAAEMILQEARG